MTHLSAETTFSGSRITGVRRCGMLLYEVKPILVGSTNISLTSAGEARNNREHMHEFKNVVFPDIVVPAMTTYGILPISATTALPVTSNPKATANFDLL